MIRHTNSRNGAIYKFNDNNIESDCSDISFINQGTEACTIFCGDSLNGRTLAAGDFVDYNNNIGGTETTRYRVEFGSGNGLKNLYVERSYKTIC
jgi:hypothetical protein